MIEQKLIFISRENEANKRKLQQLQVKLDESQNKEQGTLAKLQECIQIVEQNQFEKNEVKIFNYQKSFLKCLLGVYRT